MDIGRPHSAIWETMRIGSCAERIVVGLSLGTDHLRTCVLFIAQEMQAVSPCEGSRALRWEKPLSRSEMRGCFRRSLNITREAYYTSTAEAWQRPFFHAQLLFLSHTYCGLPGRQAVQRH